jgi:hypothetical protein
MVRILSTGLPPALPDLIPRRLQHPLVGGVLPKHEILNDLKKPLALPILRLLRLENIGMR